MKSKYGKLLLNLSNILQGAFGLDADYKHLEALLQAEAEAAYTAAGISWLDVGAADARRDQMMRSRPIPGIERSGGSTTQSLERGAGSIETDYLNGEIVLLGRLHGVPVPANTYFVELGARMVREKLKPGAISVAQSEAELAARGLVISRA